MNEISLVFYGEILDVKQHLLLRLNLLRVVPATSSRSGFYALETRYGRESIKKLSLDIETENSEAVLIYRYLSESSLDALRNASPDKKYYILPHKMFDRIYIKNFILSLVPQAALIAEFSDTPALSGVQSVKRDFKTSNVFHIKKLSPNAEKNKTDTKTFVLPLLLLFLLKVVMNPIIELQRFSILIKYSNLRVLSRLVELFLAVHFVLNVFVFRLVRLALVKLFYTTYFLTGELRVLMIRIGFAIRHLFLMTGFKGYGVFVDTFYSLKVIFNFIYYRIFYFMFSHMFNFIYYRIFYFMFSHMFNFMYYRVFYFMYYRVFYFMYYRVLCSFFPRVSNFIYYRLLYFFYYRILYFSYYRLSSYMANIFKYHLKHLFLISVYKIYGGLYDLATFSYRLTKLTLMYPFFKTYWFLSFQYKKRIKKNLV